MASITRLALVNFGRPANSRLGLTAITSNHVTSKRHQSTELRGKTVRIGCASGFWGDSSVSAPQLIHSGKINYLVFDYLSEITMSLLTAAKQKVPTMGYAPDFVRDAVGPYLNEISKKGIRVVSNAGGVNPESCAQALQEAAKKAGVELKIALISGDDLMSRKKELEKMSIVDMGSGQSFPKTCHSMNAYLGAGAISHALDNGADIVVVGRCVDSALALGPLMHEFKWSPENYDLLAAGSLAGHLIECGAQATGGIFTDWDKVPDWHNIGFPIAECAENGDCIITKPPNTGGLVNHATLSEQLVYETADPKRYLLPDVTCDFSQVKFHDVPGSEGEATFVTGARGLPPSDSYKVSATYMAGYRATAVCCVGGPRAGDKGRKTADAILTRTRGIFKKLELDDFSKVNVQIIGSEESYGPHASTTLNAREAIVWMAVHHKEKKALEIFAREIAPAGTGMAPGLTGIVGGRPKASPVLKLFSFLHPKSDIKISVNVDGKTLDEYVPATNTQVPADEEEVASSESVPSGDFSYRLEDLAYTRSGDKGNNVNIGVVARDPSFLPFIKKQLTAEAVDKYLAHLFEDRSGSLDSRINRYELPGIHGLNFVLHNALGGGGIASLRFDPQGKAVGQMLLDFKIENVPELKK